MNTGQKQFKFEILPLTVKKTSSTGLLKEPNSDTNLPSTSRSHDIMKIRLNSDNLAVALAKQLKKDMLIR